MLIEAGATFPDRPIERIPVKTGILSSG